MRSFVATIALAGMPLLGVAQTPSLTTLYNFGGGNDGANPSAGVIFATGGSIFGTTPYGGARGLGTVYELPPGSGTTRQHKVLYSFQGGNDGANPGAPLTLGLAGVLYGTTFAGGASGNGTVFQLTPPSGSGPWTETVVYTFKGGADGSGPQGGLIRIGTQLYGTTFGGGAGSAGTVFGLAPPTGGVGPWIETVIYSFKGGPDGSGPESGLLLSQGKLFGTTCCGTVGGTVFVLAPATAGTWSKHQVYTFYAKTKGAHPFGSLSVDANGVLYGTTVEGGASGAGTVFSLTPPTIKGKPYTLTTIRSFTNGADGGAPYGQPVLGPNGVLYVTVTTGCSSGVGGVLRFSPPAGGTGPWTEAVLYNFTGANDGSQPFAGVAAGTNNDLYGTTAFGGASLYGTVFKLIP